MLHRADIEAVAQRPETGMGFQLFQLPKQSFALVISSLVAIFFETRRELFQALPEANELLIVTAQLGLDSSPIRGTFIDEYRAHPWGQLISRDDPNVFALLDAGPEKPGDVSAVELFYSMPARNPQLFFRYSANRADPRILNDGRVKAGTYATTYNDIRLVPSGLAAVGRYALPVSASAEFMFPIMSDAPYRMGTALPHFGQSGGGVEVFFKDEFKTLVGEPHQIPIG